MKKQNFLVHAGMNKCGKKKRLVWFFWIRVATPQFCFSEVRSSRNNSFLPFCKNITKNTELESFTILCRFCSRNSLPPEASNDLQTGEHTVQRFSCGEA